MREMRTVAVEEAAVGEYEAIGASGELMGGDVVLEVVERDPPPGVALGQRAVSEPGEQAPGVRGD